MSRKIVIYYSFEGNSEYVAEKVAEYTQADLEKLTVSNEPPKKGLAKFLHGGKSALFKDDPGLHPLKHDLKDYDTLILIYPIWAGNCPPAMQAFLKEYRFSGKNVYLIANSASGSAGKSLDKVKEELSGNDVLLTLSLQNPLRNKEKVNLKLVEFAQQVK